MRTKADPDAFETFYKDVRGRLLLQTWALTGDLPAAQKAVRDALVIAWHHWRKVVRLDDPESFVRPQAWTHALRRHTARPFHREKGVDGQIRATLAALGKLHLTERKVLLLAHLTTLPLDQIARETGLTQPQAERELQAATAAFALQRGVPTTSIRTVFEPMAAVVDDARWPRPTILIRAGAARRRTHTFLGAVTAVAALGGGGWAVTDGAGVRPTLDGLSLTAPARPADSTPSPGRYPLSADTLLTDAQVRAALPGRWTTDLTSDSPRDALMLPCPQARPTDGKSRGALLRTFTGNQPGVTAGHATEASADVAGAQQVYAAATRWYDACTGTRLQLLSTQTVTGIGDEASVVELRDWTAPVRSVVVGVARTGVLTTTVVTTTTPARTDAVTASTQLLAQAVQQACGLPEAGSCTTTPAATEAPPMPIGDHPALISEIDLPPVKTVDQPWVGTAPAPADVNPAATRCDNATFQGNGIKGDLTRSFVIPTATLPTEFGLTETVGLFARPKAAQAFVEQIRARLAECEETLLGSTVTQTETSSAPDRDVTIWRVEVEVSEQRTVVYQMAILRNGAAVGQLGFVPAGQVTMEPGAFAALAHRAADRLVNLTG